MSIMSTITLFTEETKSNFKEQDYLVFNSLRKYMDFRRKIKSDVSAVLFKRKMTLLHWSNSSLHVYRWKHLKFSLHIIFEHTY